jgi:tetratricopeptide (TPR) repeat protein
VPSDPADVALQAEQLRGAGRPEQALGLLTEALATAPDSPLLLVELSAARRSLGDLAGAEQAVRAALQQAPTWSLALLRLLIVLVQQNRSAEAIGAAGALLAVDADSAAGWAYLALARTGLRRTSDRLLAREATRRSLELAPEDPTFRYLAAIVEHSLGDVRTARLLVDQGLSLDPQSPTLLALRAEYAPTAQQPALLVDVLTANPGDGDSKQLLDAATTWERRLALTTAAVLPSLAAVIAGIARSPLATTLIVLLLLALAGLVLARYRRRRSVLPPGYLASREASARGALVVRGLAVATAAIGAAAAAVSWIATEPAVALLALAIATGQASVLVALPDDARVLGTARAKHGRVRWGTAWRFGGLRQELALWTALAVGAVVLIGAPAAAAAGTAGGVVGLVALVGGLGVVVQLADAVVGGVNAPQRYLRRVGVRYRFLIACLMVLGLLVLGLTASLTGTIDTSTPDDGDPAPYATLVPRPSPSFPSFDFTMAPIPTISLPVSAG